MNASRPLPDTSVVIRDLIEQRGDISELDDHALGLAISESCSRHLFDAEWSLTDRRQLVRAIFNKLRGMDVLQPLLDDPTITEIMINGFDRIYIEREGRIASSTVRFRDDDHLLQVMTAAYGRKNRALSVSRPANDVLLDDGSRVHGIVWPLSPDGPAFTIRKFTAIRPDADTLIRTGFIPEAIYRRLEEAVRQKRSVFICGGTGSGKTTLLNILSSAIPAEERIITIEDSCELKLQGLPHVVRLECRHAERTDETAYDIGALIRQALRMRPDRIIVGEVRGAEAADMLEAMNTGHPGTLSTGHGNSCAAMSRRLAHLVLAATRLPYGVILRDIAEAFDLFVHIRRRADGTREVDEVCETDGIEGEDLRLRPIYRRASS